MDQNTPTKKFKNQDEINEYLEKTYSKKNEEFSDLTRKSFILSQEKSARQTIEQDLHSIRKLQNRIETLEEDKYASQHSEIYEFSFWKYYVAKNTDLFAHLMIDFGCLLVTYPFNTIKTRIQAKHPVEDVAFFTKNNASQASLYKGLTYGILASQVGVASNLFLYKYFNEILDSQFNQKLSLTTQKNITFALADMFTTPFRIVFDVRKQMLQLNDDSQQFKRTMKAIQRSFLPSMIRDVAFRLIYNSAYNQILFKNYYYYQNRLDDEQKRNLGMRSLQEYSQNITMNQKYSALMASTFLGLLITNPLDVVITRVTTQQYEKYTGFINCFKTVLREESYLKLFFGGVWARSCFYLVNGTIVFNTYGQTKQIIEDAFSY